MVARVVSSCIALLLAACSSPAPAPQTTPASANSDVAAAEDDFPAPPSSQPLRYRWEAGAHAQRVVVSETTSVTTFRGKNIEDEANVVTIDISTSVLDPRDDTFALEYTLDRIEFANTDPSTAAYLENLSGAKHRTGVTSLGESQQIDGVSDDVFSWFIGTLEAPVLPTQDVGEGTTWRGCVIWDMETPDIDIECTVAAMTDDTVTINVKGTSETWFDAPELGLDMPAAISEQHYEIECTYEVRLSEALPIAWQCAASGEASGTAKGDPFTMTTTVARSMRTPQEI